MWALTIERVDNGYILTPLGQDESDSQEWVIEDGLDGDGIVNLTSGEALLWEVMDYFNFGGSKHDAERIRIVREEQCDDS